MLSHYKKISNKLHNYLCKQKQQEQLLQIHQSHIDNNKLFKARLISWIYISVVYLWTLWDMGSITTNFIFLTLHGYFITWLFYTLVLQDYLLLKILGKQIPVCTKLKYYVQIIYEVAFCFQIPITLVFWTFLFPILLKSDKTTTEEILLNTNLHAGPMICLSIDLYFNTFKFAKKHFWVLAIYGTGYLFINLGTFLFTYFFIVYSLAVKIIYQPIDWVSILSYAITLSSYFITYGGHYLGRHIYHKYKQPKLAGRITEGLIRQNQIKEQKNQKTTVGEQQ